LKIFYAFFNSVQCLYLLISYKFTPTHKGSGFVKILLFNDYKITAVPSSSIISNLCVCNSLLVSKRNAPERDDTKNGCVGNYVCEWNTKNLRDWATDQMKAAYVLCNYQII